MPEEVFHIDIQRETLENVYYRRVIYTAKYMQVVLMSLAGNNQIGMEVHTLNDQFFRVESGTGYAIINGNQYLLEPNVALVVPAQSYHNIIATTDLKMYTIYSPPHHPDGRLDITRPLEG